MNPQHLAEAVVHWLEFESLCGRADLFSEAALRMPVGQYLKTSQDHLVVPEYDYPSPAVTRSKSIDYCLKRRSGLAVSSAIEAKWVGDTARRSLAEELFDNLYRLAVLRWPGQYEACNRWLLLAGAPSHLKSGVFDRGFNVGNKRVSAFEEILPQQKTLQPVGHRIYTVQGEARLPHAEQWRWAAEDMSQTSLPSGITSQLLGLSPNEPTTSCFACYVWRIALPQGCGYRSISRLFGANHATQALL
jgi:hypothetical protein